jgi:LPS sulfotransferase NodH
VIGADHALDGAVLVQRIERKTGNFYAVTGAQKPIVGQAGNRTGCLVTLTGMSGLGFTPVFVVGAPRSGTTWIQNMLGAHPSVCAPQETGLFHSYLNPWKEAWVRELEESSRPGARRRGLPSVLTSEQFEDLLRRTAVGVYQSALDSKPSALVLLDKEPTNTFHLDLIVDLFPEARLIHLLRDGRDVTSSLVAAHDGWARDWAPSRVADGARAWQEHVRAARAGRDLGVPFVEVRYENLLRAPVDSLLDLFDFAGVRADRDAAQAIADEFSFERVRSNGGGRSGISWAGELSRSGPAAEPEGFYRRGTAGSWQDEWSTYQKAEFDRVAGELLVALGYEQSRAWWPRSPAMKAVQAGGTVRDQVEERTKDRLRDWISKHPSLRRG